jgi:HEPN domain-containing protein
LSASCREISKSVLNNKWSRYKKTHNIEFLLSECSDIDKDFIDIDPKELSDFGVDARYPGDLYIPTESETLEYKKLAFEIKELVEIKIYKMINL